MLEENKILRYLDLGFLKMTAALGECPNRIEAEGAKHIAHALTTNRSLMALELLHNNIHQDGFEALRSAMCDDPPNAANLPPRVLVHMNLQQFGVPFNELALESIRFRLKRTYQSMTDELRATANEAIDPAHLQPIASVYRVGGKYKEESSTGA
jgi:hypothetical protein